LLVIQRDLTPEWLAARLGELLSNRPRLLAMGEIARGLDHPDAVERIAAACWEVSGKGQGPRAEGQR
jgi:UDP-N-acetylglucosamine:LPS N-acetylglucosamine transferase